MSKMRTDDPARGPLLPQMDRLGKMGALVIWDANRVCVSFLGRSISDGDLSILDNFVVPSLGGL